MSEKSNMGYVVGENLQKKTSGFNQTLIMSDVIPEILLTFFFSPLYFIVYRYSPYLSSTFSKTLVKKKLPFL